MAFKLFPKSTKPTPSSANGDAQSRGRAGAAREPLTVTRGGRPGDPDWIPQSSAIEVDENGGLGPSLENAALMFAHGNVTAATAALVHALDTAERTQPFVWMCLFDLYARADNRVAFDDLALRFVVQFERSAPSWDEMASGSARGSTGDASQKAKPRSLLRGQLTDPHAPVLVALMAGARRKDATAAQQRFDLDIGDLDGVDDTCGTLLAGALSALRRKGAVVAFRALEGTIRRLSVPLQAGNRSNRGQWYLVLELLQWASLTTQFEDRAVDFAVTFEISPPSAEPLTPLQRSVLSDAATSDARSDASAALPDDRIALAGELKGSNDANLKLLDPDRVTTNPAIVDMRQVLRVDFVCGGAIANACTRLMAQAIDVHVVGATPIVQALLQLTGTPASVFARR